MSVILVGLQSMVLQACAPTNNLQIIVLEQDQKLMKDFDTLAMGFELLRQYGQNIPTFKIFIQQKISSGEVESEEDFYVALLQARNMIVDGLKGRLMQILLNNRALYGNVYGPGGQIQDPLIKYIKDHDIKNWFREDNNQSMSEQNQRILMSEPIYEESEEEQDSLDEALLHDWWTVSHEGVLGYRSSMSMNEMSDNSDYY